MAHSPRQAIFFVYNRAELQAENENDYQVERSLGWAPVMRAYHLQESGLARSFSQAQQMLEGSDLYE